MQKERIIPITNAVMFAMVMQDKELCRQVLETLLQIEIDHLEDVKTEEVLKPAYETKGVRATIRPCATTTFLKPVRRTRN